jgi:Domain of unknown function (DUF4116)
VTVNLGSVSERLRGDKEFVLKCISVPDYGQYFQFASEALRSDRDVVLAALAAYDNNVYYPALYYTSGDILDDDEVAKIAVKASPRNFYYLSERLKGDKELAVAACVGTNK